MVSDHWVVNNPEGLLWRDWGEFGVVYDETSGSTHLLDALALEMLSLLVQRPLSEADLQAELRDAMPPELGAPEVIGLISAQLQRLQVLGLAYPAQQIP